ncbi:PREDICTED: protein crumbs homolog 1 [Nanorana parkeri]|uniref:protein crumbs homolog 1 n=1 Tax=Nanorana parkeri TaxID=125878 RepID=UPI0008546CD7|nr:PREDICTED: protein crumbs homolog 1 [Nanorana parkeri]
MRRCHRTLCSHGGLCYVTDRGSTCFCPVGYKGTFCETPEDECLWNPCQNGAVCRERGNGQACYCVPGFQGALCNIEVDECISNPCQHGGSCLNEIGRYTCVCPSQFTGRDCEVEFDECSSGPCLNGATCYDLLGSFSCTCPAGFSGDLCNININECESSPCLNGGLCVDKNNGYQCNCMVGYTGANCEVSASLCSSQPCQNNATCIEDSVSFKCLCWPGYTGPLCETDVHKCKSQPCKFGMECVELPWFNGSVRDTRDEEQFSGYICKCGRGLSGVHCEQDINECESNPCQNGGTCENLNGTYTCHCPTIKDPRGHYYGGSDCTEKLRGCEKQTCYNGGSCVPYMMDGKHHHTCLCPAGFRGPDCRAQTTFSFNGRTILPIRNITVQPQGGSFSIISLSFSTVQTTAVIFSIGTKPASLTLSIEKSFLFLDFLNTQWSTLLHLSHNVSDNLWHTVEIIIAENIQLRVLDPSCDNTCVSLSKYEGPTIIEFQGMSIGGIQPAKTRERNHNNSTEEIQSWFVGCLRDIRVGSTVITEEFGESVGVEVGCQRQDHCENHPCENRGKCMNLWINYHCDCYRPYRGINCSAEYQAVEFGHGNVSSYAIFHNLATHMDDITLSAFVRAEHDSGLLFALGNSTTYDITVFIEDGKLTAKAGSGIILKGEFNINDFQFHLVSLKLTKDNFEVYTSSTSISQISMTMNKQQNISTLYVGGLVNHLETILNGGYFKGCIQDLRIDDQPLQFFHSSKSIGDPFLSNVTKGCTNNCPTAGKTCEQNWCQLTQCPLGSVCQPLPSGYECKQAVLLVFFCEYQAVEFGHGNVSSYAIFHNLATHMDDITLSAFVRAEHDSGLLFALGNSTTYDITVFIEDGKLTAKAGSGIILKGEFNINDFQFHLVSLKLTKDNFEVYTSSTSISQISMTMNKQQNISTLYVGGLVNHLETILNGGYFKGCIQDLRIDDQPLQFFHSSKSIGDPFLSNVTKGCTNNCPTAGKTCEQNWCQLTQCPLGSVCQPLPSGYECVSNAFFSGEGNGILFRSNGKITRDLTNLTIGFRTLKSDSVLLHANREPERITISVQDKKLHFYLQSGNGLSAVTLISVVSVSDSQWHSVSLSMVAPGLQSSIWQMEIDGKPEMIGSQATGNLNFLKEGTEIYVGINNNGSNRNFTGCLGTVLIEGIHLPYFADSDYFVTKPQKEQFVKISPASVAIGCLQSDPCASQPCMNGGSCNDVFTQPVCTCPAWKTGTFCEVNITECASNPCVHGNCSVVNNGYKCECEDGYSGTNCEIHSCHGHLCRSGATCIAGTAGYFCLCPANFTGLNCRFNRMPSTFCGDKNKNITCYNYSNCTEVNGVLGCSCLPGFVGKRCEIDFDECESNPCLNGGLCQNLPNEFHCICDLNFAGTLCEIDLSDFLPPGVFTVVASVVLALFFAVCAGLCIFIVVASMRSNQGTYSPSRQEKEGSRVEMWNIVQPPHLERLI